MRKAHERFVLLGALCTLIVVFPIAAIRVTSFVKERSQETASHSQSLVHLLSSIGSPRDTMRTGWVLERRWDQVEILAHYKTQVSNQAILADYDSRLRAAGWQACATPNLDLTERLAKFAEGGGLIGHYYVKEAYEARLVQYPGSPSGDYAFVIACGSRPHC